MAILQAEKLHPSLHPTVPVLGFNGSYLVMFNSNLHSCSRKTTHARKRCLAVFSGLPIPEEKHRHQRVITIICGRSGQHSGLLVCLLKITDQNLHLKNDINFSFLFLQSSSCFYTKEPFREWFPCLPHILKGMKSFPSTVVTFLVDQEHSAGIYLFSNQVGHKWLLLMTQQ